MFVLKIPSTIPATTSLCGAYTLKEYQLSIDDTEYIFYAHPGINYWYELTGWWAPDYLTVGRIEGRDDVYYALSNVEKFIVDTNGSPVNQNSSLGSQYYTKEFENAEIY